MSSVPTFRSYAFTFRPRDGVTDPQVTTMAKWIRKNAVYYKLITEKTGSERHIHVGFILHEARPRSNVLMRLMNLYKSLAPDEKSVLRSGLKIMYNWDWVNAYLDKGDDTVVILENLPEDGHIESFFPAKPSDTPVESRQKKCSLYYHELEALFYKHENPGSEINTVTLRDFLFKMMYSERCIPVIRDDKMIIQTARHLCRWLNKSCTSTIELAPFEKEEN